MVVVVRGGRWRGGIGTVIESCCGRRRRWWWRRWERLLAAGCRWAGPNLAGLCPLSRLIPIDLRGRRGAGYGTRAGQKGVGHFDGQSRRPPVCASARIPREGRHRCSSVVRYERILRAVEAGREYVIKVDVRLVARHRGRGATEARSLHLDGAGAGPNVPPLRSFPWPRSLPAEQKGRTLEKNFAAGKRNATLSESEHTYLSISSVVEFSTDNARERRGCFV